VVDAKEINFLKVDFFFFAKTSFIDYLPELGMIIFLPKTHANRNQTNTSNETNQVRFQVIIRQFQ
jgi:hypothetical protein